MKAYLLEDDSSISGLVKVAMDMNHLECVCFSTKRAFMEGLGEGFPDIALLDIMVPDGSGLDVLRYMKEKMPSCPVIMLTALSREEDKVNGLNLGADDYVTKPFSVLELMARVNARLRDKKRPDILSAKGVEINKETMTAALDGEPLTLNRKEFELLSYFVENEGKVLSRDNILAKVWGYDAGDTRTLDNHVSRLRKYGVKIETVFGIGYRF